MRDAFAATAHRIPEKGDVGVLLPCTPNERAKLEPLVNRFQEAGIEILALDRIELAAGVPHRDVDVRDALKTISAGKASFVLSFNANSNQLAEDLRRVTRKAAELQVQIITTPEEAEAMLDCVLAAQRR